MAVIPDQFLDDVARRFALLGDPTRLKIVSVLHERGECTVGQVADASATSMATASQHLQRLAVGGIVGRQRDGHSVYYRIVDDTIAKLCSIVCGSLAGGDSRPQGDTVA